LRANRCRIWWWRSMTPMAASFYAEFVAQERTFHLPGADFNRARALHV
jgi:hypothetical protein